MSPSSSNKVEEDAWLMKIELKREEPEETIKGDKAKEVTGDQVSAVGRAVPVAEEEDILQPYYDYLTPTEIEAFRVIEMVRVQNKQLTRGNVMLQEHIISLRSIIYRLENHLSLKCEAITSSPPSSSYPTKET
jgi:hypothetical protein